MIDSTVLHSSKLSTLYLACTLKQKVNQYLFHGKSIRMNLHWYGSGNCSDAWGRAYVCTKYWCTDSVKLQRMLKLIKASRRYDKVRIHKKCIYMSRRVATQWHWCWD